MPRFVAKLIVCEHGKKDTRGTNANIELAVLAESMGVAKILAPQPWRSGCGGKKEESHPMQL